MSIQVVDKWVFTPLTRFINQSTASGIVLFSAAIAVFILSNSFLSAPFNAIWETRVGFSFGSFTLYKPLLLWINDGLMSMFFFVVGLELKREMVAGELSNPRDAVLPIVAGVGGMLVPALIYTWFNGGSHNEASNGWGIPMATDIAFTLGVVYMLGRRVPLSLKIFLTALSIIDDLGAVTVIAFFYTSSVSLPNLGIAAVFFLLMVLGNRIGIRSSTFYGVLGIGGLWLAFLLSGVHATIAAVLAAFTIPATVEINKETFLERVKALVRKYARYYRYDTSMASHEEYDLLSKIQVSTDAAISPLQRLEHALHPLVAFFVIPLFALANAGIALPSNLAEVATSPVALGVGLGLIVGKVVGIMGFVFLFQRLRIVRLPAAINYKNLLGAAFLAAIGFTMSLFITTLAFDDPVFTQQAKFGILTASSLAGLIGYSILRSVSVPERYEDKVHARALRLRTRKRLKGAVAVARAASSRVGKGRVKV
jgi:Na+:H+ antiporter, NhaA family